MCRFHPIVAVVLFVQPAAVAAQDFNRFVGRISISGVKASAVAVHPESKYEVNGFANGTMSFYLMDTKVYVTIEGFPAHGKTAVTALRFSPDGKWVASAGKDGKVRLWETADLARFQGGCQNRKDGEAKPLYPTPKKTFIAHPTGVAALAYSPDGKRLATGGIDGAVKLWDLETAKSSLSIAAHRGGAHTVAFSPDGESLVSGGADKTAKVWQATSGKLLRTLADHQGPVLAAAFSPDGKQLATASGVLKKSGQVRVWDAATGKEEFNLGELADLATTLSFHPSLPRLAVGSADKKIHVFNTMTKKEIYTDEHAGPLIHIAFSADGKLLGSVCPEELKWWLGSPRVGD